MKYPNKLEVLACILAGFFIYAACPSSTEARIGESRQSIEGRLLGAGGIVYRDDVIEANRQKGMPYLDYMAYLPGSAEVRIYFKTADGRRPTSSELEEKGMPNGWDLHVVFIGGKSAIEVYKRSQGMTDFEFNHLMALHAGSGYWKRLEKGDQDEVVTAFGFDMVRSDENVRAKKMGKNAVMFFDAEIDKTLAEMNISDLQEKAPVSVGGF